MCAVRDLFGVSCSLWQAPRFSGHETAPPSCHGLVLGFGSAASPGYLVISSQVILVVFQHSLRRPSCLAFQFFPSSYLPLGLSDSSFCTSRCCRFFFFSFIVYLRRYRARVDIMFWMLLFVRLVVGLLMWSHVSVCPVRDYVYLQ